MTPERDETIDLRRLELDQLRAIAPNPARSAGVRARCRAATVRRAHRRAARRSLAVGLAVVIPLLFLLAVVRDLVIVRVWR
ncbi:MAG TPA: hypothetical protein VFV78_05715 [Vicinamibacterales bacterium]|nr:hypothetical protein [Vicinamibacterales bacterium]